MGQGGTVLLVIIILLLLRHLPRSGLVSRSFRWRGRYLQFESIRRRISFFLFLQFELDNRHSIGRPVSAGDLGPFLLFLCSKQFTGGRTILLLQWRWEDHFAIPYERTWRR